MTTKMEQQLKRILQELTRRQDLKQKMEGLIKSSFSITESKKDRLPRGIVHKHILSSLNLSTANDNIYLLKEVLSSLGIKESIIDGKLYYSHLKDI